MRGGGCFACGTGDGVCGAHDVAFAAIRGRMAKRVRTPRATQKAATPDEAAVVAESPIARNGTCPGPALVFVVPMPSSPNRSGLTRNHFAVAREKKRYGEALDLYATLSYRRAGLAHPAEFPWIVAPRHQETIHNAVITVTEIVVGATNDEDNLAYRVKKWVGDWLVTRGYIATDMPLRKRDGASLTWAAFPAQHVTRKEPARISLHITEREPE